MPWGDGAHTTTKEFVLQAEHPTGCSKDPTSAANTLTAKEKSEEKIIAFTCQVSSVVPDFVRPYGL